MVALMREGARGQCGGFDEGGARESVVALMREVQESQCGCLDEGGSKRSVLKVRMVVLTREGARGLVWLS